MRYNRIKKMINKYDVISFDIFDTAIKRDVERPKDVFKLINKKAALIGVDNYSTRRVEAENNSRENAVNREVNLDDIYACFVGVTSDQIKKLKQFEIETELYVVCQNRNIYEVYQECLRQNKQVYFVSDMYLSSEIIAGLLNKCGYNKYDKLYVSNEASLNKKSGVLFRKILNDNGLSSRRVLHIGNSKKADVLGAMKAGVRAAYVPTYEEHRLYYDDSQIKTFEDRRLKAYINNHCVFIDNRAKQLGYELLGPLVYSYCKWLHDNSQDMDTLLFFARDMHLFYNAYTAMYPEDKEKIRYVRASRKSLWPALIICTDDFYGIMRLWTKKKLTIAEVFELLNLKISDYLEKLNAAGILDITEYCSYREHPVWDFLSANRESIHEANIESGYLAKEYLISYLNGSRIAICDLGWHATTQIISQIIADNCSIPCHFKGFYVGTYGSDEYDVDESGYLFDKDSIDYRFGTASFVMEAMCLELCGTALSYRKDGKIIRAVLDECEQEYPEYIENIQAGCNLLIYELSQKPITKDAFSKEYVMAAYVNYLNSPQRVDLDEMRLVSYFDKQKSYVINNKKRLYYVFHLNELKRDFFSVRWKGGFLSVLFGFNWNWQEKYYRLVWKRR